jgi:predicted RNA binding protein YcfA (HicA-like mRNA interferase family)
VSALPVLSGRQLVKVFGRLGYAVDRQRGSHIILRHSKPPYQRLVVPDHAEIAKGTLRALLREAGLTVDELRRML